LRKNGEVFLNEIAITDTSDNRGAFSGFIREIEKRNTEAAWAELLHVARLSDLTAIPCSPLSAVANHGASIAHVLKVIETQRIGGIIDG
jgi:hypothetical protein